MELLCIFGFGSIIFDSRLTLLNVDISELIVDSDRMQPSQQVYISDTFNVN